MNIKKRHSSALPVLIIVAVLIAAAAVYFLIIRPSGGEKRPEEPNTATDLPAQAVPNYTVRASYNTLNLRAGGSEEAVVRVYNDNGAIDNSCTLRLESDNGCVTVDGMKITATSNGTATVTVTAVNQSNVVVGRSKISVTVSDNAPWYGGATYIKGILLVNKEFSIPREFGPEALTEETDSSAKLMIDAAARDGLTLWIQSGYRSYDYQSRLYEMNREWYGNRADLVSARPGHSEHQTGCAIDLNTITDDFAFTAEGKWVAEHAHEYGFILRYGKNQTSVTGYDYEPWHIRYVGVKAATEIFKSGQTLEEYLGVKTLVTYNFD